MSEPNSLSGQRFIRLVEVMERLLAPDGCPWDREQTLTSLRPFLLEETYEVLDAMDEWNTQHHADSGLTQAVGESRFSLEAV